MSLLDSSIVNSPNLSKFGATLHINEPCVIQAGSLVAADCETDEKDNFVGIALCNSNTDVWYYSELNDELKACLSSVLLLGHNLKADARWLKQWGANTRPEMLGHDTMLMSYVRDNSRESHGLKDLALDLLGMSWPSYKEIVGSGAKRQTLDKQDIDIVANYCACDTLATWRLYHYFASKMSPTRLSFYNEHELPLMRILFEMELKGIQIDVDYLKDLQFKINDKFIVMHEELIKLLDYKPVCKKSCPKKAHKHEFNPSSPIQVKEALRTLGVHVKSTNKSVLKDYTHVPFVSKLLDYKKIAKIKTTYVDALLELPTLPWIHSTFNQVAYDAADDSWQGIRTGRLSSSDPNLQNIPSPKDEEDPEDVGKLVRTAFVPSANNTLICADYSQIEYRLLGHFTMEPVIVEAYKNGVDIHKATGEAIGASRKLGKTINFAAIYGAGPAKISRTADITPQQAQGFLDAYWKALPRVTAWVKQVKLNAFLNKGIQTIGGRWIPLPSITPYGAMTEAQHTLKKINETRAKRGDRMLTLPILANMIQGHNERVAVNATIQGSAADVIRMAMINLKHAGIVPNLQVHDELLFDYGGLEPELFMQQIVNAMTTPYKETLRVPLEVSINSGKNWQEAK